MIDIKNIVAVDYKGKHFILHDKDRVDDRWDITDPNIHIDYVVNVGLHEHIHACNYYGIPAYIGSNEELKKKIEEIR